MTLVTDQSETPGGPATGDHFGNGPQQETTWAVGVLERTRGLLRLEVQLLLALVLLYLGFSIIEPDIFISIRTIENLARQAGVLLVASVGADAGACRGWFRHLGRRDCGIRLHSARAAR